MKAMGAAVLLNVVLLCSFGWSELISSGMRNMLCSAVVLFWTASAVTGYVQTNRRANRKPLTPAKDTFTQALDLYLKGDNFQAECLLVEMLGRDERDLDARLMLATLYSPQSALRRGGKTARRAYAIRRGREMEFGNRARTGDDCGRKEQRRAAG